MRQCYAIVCYTYYIVCCATLHTLVSPFGLANDWLSHHLFCRIHYSRNQIMSWTVWISHATIAIKPERIFATSNIIVSFSACLVGYFLGALLTFGQSVFSCKRICVNVRHFCCRINNINNMLFIVI